MAIRPIILSGGSGTRLWPMSREHYPKQLLSLVGQGTLLQQTLNRLDGIGGMGQPVFVCNEEHRFLVAEQVRESGQEPGGIILEPVGRNTAPALTLAALYVAAREPEALLLAMPADHVVRDVSAFQRAVEQARPLAETGKLVTFGIVPTQPETGYGYIRRRDDGRVSGFVEKPDLETARSYVSSGEYLWNSGMFMMRAEAWLSEIGRLAPRVLNACRAAFDGGTTDADFFRVQREAFLACPSDSIDYAVMEKTDKAVCVPLDAGWSDIGAWSALWEIGERDSSGNVVQGDVLVHETKNALLVAQHRLLATVGLDNIIAIETPDAVLVAHKDAAQDVKHIVARLKNAKRSEHQFHRRVYRPWGYYEGVDLGERFQVKRLQVKPGASLSLQMHHHRAEHWVVVKGTARVTRGVEVILLSENESTFIPVGTKHRLENPGNIPLEIIEVQSGAYLGEDDIVRFDDQYNRHKKT